jgi:hypothetical protein
MERDTLPHTELILWNRGTSTTSARGNEENIVRQELFNNESLLALREEVKSHLLASSPRDYCECIFTCFCKGASGRMSSPWDIFRGFVLSPYDIDPRSLRAFSNCARSWRGHGPKMTVRRRPGAARRCGRCSTSPSTSKELGGHTRVGEGGIGLGSRLDR